MQRLYTIGGPNPEIGPPAPPAPNKPGTVSIGGYELSLESVQKLATTPGNQNGPATNTDPIEAYKSSPNTNISTVVDGTARGLVNSAAPGLGNLVPPNHFKNLLNVAYGDTASKPMGKWSLGDISKVLFSIVVVPYNWIGRAFNIGQSENAGKKENFVDENGPHFYKPNDLVTTYHKAPNFPPGFTGQLCRPLHSPWLALLTLNQQLCPPGWSWVIAQVPRTVNDVVVDPTTYAPRSYYFYAITPAGEPNFDKYVADTNKWMETGWELNGMPNSDEYLGLPQADFYKVYPGIDPGPRWAAAVARNNPSYWKTFIESYGNRFAENLIAAMKKAGIDPFKVNPRYLPPAPGTTPAPTPGQTKAKTNTAVASAVPILGAGFLIYQFFLKK
jgi:hypothetical protein